MSRDRGDLLREFEPQWDEVRRSRVLKKIHREYHGEPQRSGARWWVAGGVLTAAAAAALLLWVLPNAGPEKVAVVDSNPVAPIEAPFVELADGVKATLFAQAEVSVVTRSASRTAVVQSNGAAKYEVDPQKHVAFEVTVQGVHIRVLGTVFQVTSEERLVRVAVSRGRVQVTHLGGVSILEMGQEGEFYGISPITDPDADTAEEEVIESPADDEATRGPSQRVTLPSPQDLQRAADEARRIGQDRLAAAHLRKLLRLYPRDPSAIVARFTLGRIETARGRHLEAAKQFMRLRKDAPHGPLAEDALGEEAWSRHLAGQEAQARALALQYIERFPDGPHAPRLSVLVQNH